MFTKEIICLANSKKNNYRCIAGIDIKTGEWIRPVSDTDTGELTLSQIKYPDWSIPSVLDIIKIPFDKHSPKFYQKENYTISEGNWEKTGSCRIEELEKYLETPSLLWCNDSPDKFKIDVTYLEQQSGYSSLLLIKPREFKFHKLTKVVDHISKISYRAFFVYNETDYNFTITDKHFLEKCFGLDDGIYTIEDQIPYLCISLGEPKPPMKKLCYKILATVIFSANIVKIGNIPDNNFAMGNNADSVWEKKDKDLNIERFVLTQIVEAYKSSFDYPDKTPEHILNSLFSFSNFKPKQNEIIESILKKENVFAVLKTGGGKSLCYQIPALIIEGITVVVSPLISLMGDQVINLCNKGLHYAFFINSSLTDEVKEFLLQFIDTGKIKVVFIAPEGLDNEDVLDILNSKHVGLFVIDEVHCISTWGHDFRPEYRKLNYFISRLGNPPVAAFTATATELVEQDIKSLLNVPFKHIRSSFDRENLFLGSVFFPDNAEKHKTLLNLIKNLYGPTIIYATKIKLTNKLAGFLNENGFNAISYNSKSQNKLEKQLDFLDGKTDIVVATTAFGMGIDKSNIRNIIHYNLSHSIENYYQEIGRAGRDDQDSVCITLYCEKDVERVKRLISYKWPGVEKIESTISKLCEYEKQKFTSIDMLSKELDIDKVACKLILQKLEDANQIKYFKKVPFKYSVTNVFEKLFYHILTKVIKLKNVENVLLAHHTP